jgi:NADPH oxidase 2
MSGRGYPEEEDVIYEKATERSRWPHLTRMLMTGEMSAEQPRELSMRDKFNRWMVNEGYRRMCVLQRWSSYFG